MDFTPYLPYLFSLGVSIAGLLYGISRNKHDNKDTTVELESVKKTYETEAREMRHEISVLVGRLSEQREIYTSQSEHQSKDVLDLKVQLNISEQKNLQLISIARKSQDTIG